jgi:hypothetical protein
MKAPDLRRLAPALAAVTMLLAACASAPTPPDWKLNARQAVDAAVVAYLEGNARAEAAESARARGEIARTGRADLLARAELMRCAARVASLVFEPCEGFESLRADAAAAELAYADYLAGRIAPPQIALLPEPHRAVAAAANDAAAAAALRAIDDPLSRLIAAGVLFQTSRATPEVLQIAVDTASSQGWRRPLLAWLNVQLLRAERAGAFAEAERLRRRIDIVQGSP